MKTKVCAIIENKVSFDVGIKLIYQCLSGRG